MAGKQDRYAETRQIAQMLVRIAERAKADFARIVEPLDLPVHLARAVLLLDQPAPMRDLAYRLNCDRSYITSIADQLEDRGLIERVPGEDRRIKLLTLTPAGTTLRDELSESVAEQSMVNRRLTDTQRQALVPILEALLGDDEELGDPACPCPPGQLATAPASE